MVVIQCTAALLGKIKKYVEIEDLEALRKSDDAIGSITDFFAWHANLHPFDQAHSRYTDSNTIPGFKSIRNSIVLTHNVSQAPAFIIAARAATYKNFAEEVKRALAMTLLMYDATEDFVREYLKEPLRFTRTGTRQQLGLHKEIAQSVQWAAPDFVRECGGSLDALPKVMTAHMFKFIVGGKDYHMLGERMQQGLKELNGLLPQVDPWEERQKRQQREEMETNENGQA